MRKPDLLRATMALALLGLMSSLSCSSNDTAPGPFPCPTSCPAGEPFCGFNGSCVECRSTADCGADEACGLDGDCVNRCSTNDQCGGGAPLCDAANGVCVECFTSADCAATSHPICIGGGRCSDCASAADCDPDERCDLQEGRCE